MEMKTIKSFVGLVFLICLILPFQDINSEVRFVSGGQETKEERTSETWMGAYMNGIKVGYNHSQELSLTKNGKKYRKTYNKSWIKISRLGGNPVEIITILESLYDEQGRPIETLMRMKMSETETLVKAEIKPDKILFKSGDKVFKELPYEEKFYLATPLKEIIKKQGLKPGIKYNFKILDPTTYSLVETRFEVIGKEEVLILGKKMNLWHVREKASYVIPITVDEMVDESGNSWKTVSQTSFSTLTSIRMPKEKALEISEENFDIAFSSVIRTNTTFENPQEIQRVTFKLSGIPPDKIKRFPFDDGSQDILEVGKDYVVIQTSSQIFTEKDATPFPVEDEKFQEFLEPTFFCQSDDPEIKKLAEDIVSQEKNSWRAAKKISEWIKDEMIANYDVGFASAKEILKNREGDCSEHTVLTVALCRAVGIPARAAVGIMYAHGIFAYHMWPEVYVGRWVGLDSKWLAIDKKSGEYYTDATHIKFGRSNLDENIFREMAQAISEIIGKLRLEIVDYYQDK